MLNGSENNVIVEKKAQQRAQSLLKTFILVLLTVGLYFVFQLLTQNNKSNKAKIESDSNSPNKLIKAKNNSYAKSIQSFNPQSQANKNILKEMAPTVNKNELKISKGEKVYLSQSNLNSTNENNITSSDQLIYQLIQLEHGQFGNLTNMNITTFTQAQINQEDQIYFQHDGSKYSPDYSVVVKIPDCPGVVNCTSSISSANIDFNKKDNAGSSTPDYVPFVVGVGSSIIAIGLGVASFFGIRKIRKSNAEREAIRSQNPHIYDFLKYLAVKDLSLAINESGWKRVYNALLESTSLDMSQLLEDQQKQLIKCMATACKEELFKHKLEVSTNNIETYQSEINDLLADKVKSINIGRASLTSKDEVNLTTMYKKT